MDAECVKDLAGEVRARVRAANPSEAPEAELVTFGDCGSALIDVLLLLSVSATEADSPGSVMLTAGSI